MSHFQLVCRSFCLLLAQGYKAKMVRLDDRAAFSLPHQERMHSFMYSTFFTPVSKFLLKILLLTAFRNNDSKARIYVTL